MTAVLAVLMARQIADLIFSFTRPLGVTLSLQNTNLTNRMHSVFPSALILGIKGQKTVLIKTCSDCVATYLFRAQNICHTVNGQFIGGL